jgi:hypothetical protein
MPLAMEKVFFTDGSGSLDRFADFPSQFVQPRHVDIWTPPDYDRDLARRYPVVYMHDGQNLFDPAAAFSGVDWGMDEAVDCLIQEGEIFAPIIVAVWNTPLRFREYCPQMVYEASDHQDYRARVRQNAGGEPLADSYLKFLVYEVKPWIDAAYRTLPGPAQTLMMGSSMGGLVSLYAAVEYPRVFGGVGCLSTHFPAVDEGLITYLLGYLPEPGENRFYFDYGTQGLDASYPPYQARVDGVMEAVGYQPGKDWQTLRFEGADHSEAHWRERVHIPLKFLLSPA